MEHENENRIESLNEIIDCYSTTYGLDKNEVSDGYHTFGELYKHRIHLFIALCKNLYGSTCFRSYNHNDGTSFDGWFLLQLNTHEGQISYHLPEKYWDSCDFAQTLEKARKWDGHNSNDVLNRLLKL